MDKPLQQSMPSEKSCDTLFEGDLFCVQHAKGYRFSIDPVLLAHFVRLKKEESVLDLGAGCGIIGLILLYRFSNRISSLTAFELQPGLAALCRENVLVNSFQEKMKVKEGDLRTIRNSFPAGSFSTVVCNPPFYIPGSGRTSTNTEALIARHQVECSLDEILSAAAYAVKNKGKLFLIYPAELLAVLSVALRAQGFAIKRLQFIYSYPEKGESAKLLLIEALRNGGEGLRVEEPLYIYEKKDGEYSLALQGMYQRNA